MTPTPHDALVKATYSDPARAAAHLASVLPPEVVARLDLSRLEVLPGTYIHPDLAESSSDLLYSVGLRSGGSLLVYLLFEHQSSVDRLMALRLVLYAARVLDRWWSEHPEAVVVPPILPLVLYHGERSWTVGRSLSDAWGLDPEDQAALAGRGLELSYQLHDLSEHSDASLRSRALDALDLLVQLLLKHGRDEDLMDQLDRWADVWRAVADGPGLRAIAQVLSYIGIVAGRRSPLERVQRFLVQTLGPRGEEAFMTWQEQIEARGEARGRENQRRMFLSLLRQRFGAISTTVEARVAAASTDELTAWTEGFFAASSPEQLLGLSG